MEIRCSGLARPMVCAGSLFFENLPEQETNAPAMEGTAAGEYLQALIETGAPPHAATATNGVAFDDDMRFHTEPIAQAVRENAATEVLCEKRIDWLTRSGVWIRGQYDMSYVGNDGKLYIDDLKYGWVPVDVFENWQLLGYAIGEVIRRQTIFDKIVLRVHQPRPHHEDGQIRAWELSYNELLSYKEKIEKRMEDISNGEKTLVTSSKCKYCPAAASACPAMSKMFYRGIEVSHEFMQDDIDEKELSFQLDLITRATEVLKIKSDSLKALAVDRIRKGKLIPNYVSEQILGDRKWKTGVTPDMIEALTGKKVVTSTMLSPAQAEKMGVPKEFVASIVDRHFAGTKVVRKDTTKIGNKIFGGNNG